jgi:hypothetical protein
LQSEQNSNIIEVWKDGIKINYKGVWVMLNNEKALRKLNSLKEELEG